jgi:hypothetical protein
MPGKQKDDQPSGLHKAIGSLDDRRDVRFEVPIEIEVSGIDQSNQVFHEMTCTKNVSEWGCAFLLSFELKVHDIVALRVTSNEASEFEAARQSPFQILRVTREKDRWLVGAWKVDNGDVWGANLEQISKHLEERAQKSCHEVDAKPGKRPQKDADQ